MNCISSCTTNVSNNWKISVAVTVVSVALMILATQNLNLKHFEGIGHLGSNILLGVGAGIALLSFAIASCTKPKAAIKQLDPGEKPQGSAQTATNDKALDRNASEHCYRFSDTQEQWKVANTLSGKEVLFSVVEGQASIHYVGERGITVETIDRGIKQILDEISRKEKCHISKDKVEKALSIQIPDGITKLNEAEQAKYQDVLLREEYIEFQQGDITLYLTSEGVKSERSGTICERQPALLELRIQNKD